MHAHLGADDGMTARAPVLDRYPDFAALIEVGEDEEMPRRLRRSETIGRPLGSDRFLAGLEAQAGRSLKPGKRGPRPRLAGAPSPN